MKYKKYFYLAVLLSVFLISSCGESEKQLERLAAEIHNEILTIDTHCDTPMLMLRGHDVGVRNPGNEYAQVDFPRMKEGGLDAAFFAVFLPQGELTQSGYDSAHELALRMFDAIHESLDKYQDMAELALAPDDAQKIADKGKRAIYIGVENAYPIGMDISRLHKYYELGARYVTLCHNINNQICDASSDSSEPLHNGLSDFGREIVKEMNRMGMIVDVSHLADQSVKDVIQISRAPVIASHSNASAINDHRRTMSDELLKMVAENGGAVHVTFASSHVGPLQTTPEYDSARAAVRKKWNNFEGLTEEEWNMGRAELDEMVMRYPVKRPSVSDLVDHIDHIVKVAGIDHVGIGSDFDGGGRLQDINDVTEIVNLTLELVKRGYNREEIEKIWSGNFIRVFEEVEQVALRLQE